MQTDIQKLVDFANKLSMIPETAVKTNSALSRMVKAQIQANLALLKLVKSTIPADQLKPIKVKVDRIKKKTYTKIERPADFKRNSGINLDGTPRKRRRTKLEMLIARGELPEGTTVLPKREKSLQTNRVKTDKSDMFDSTSMRPKLVKSEALTVFKIESPNKENRKTVTVGTSVRFMDFDQNMVTGKIKYLHEESRTPDGDLISERKVSIEVEGRTGLVSKSLNQILVAE